MESPSAAPSSTLLVLQLKSLVAYKSNDEYLYAMKEDLAEWFMCLYQLDITVDNFFEVLETGVILCEHANNVRNYANEQRKLGKFAVIQSNFVRGIQIPEYEVQFRTGVKPQTFQARDNLSNFITWTKNLGIPEVLSFETDDLVLRKNEKSVVLCLLEVARVGAKLGMLAPTLVRMEEEIDAEIESGEPPPQVITCDLKSLDEMVQWLAGRCTCPVQFPITKVGEGKYKIGDSQTLVFVRILRNHVMIRVGGGWDTLEHYLDKHDPCRCGFSGHRQGGSVTKTPTRRASTPAVSHSVPTPSKSQRKLSMAPPSTSVGNSSQRPASPARMRSASPGPTPKGLPVQNSGTTKPPLSPLSPTGSVNNSHILVQRTYSVPSTPRRSQSPVPVSRLRSPSPVSSVSRSFVAQQRESLQSKVPRPSSPVKRTSSPGPCVTSSPAARGCVSPSPRSSTASPGPNRRNKILSIPRSKSTTPQIERRQLPQRPNMDSSGNDSEETDVTSGSSHPAVDMNQISTMTLDEFKNLLNSALSVPNGNVSEGSQESPRSQSSTEGTRASSHRTGVKKPFVPDKSPRTRLSGGNVSRSLDSHGSISDKTNNSRTVAPNGYYEMEKPAVRRTILASSANHRPKTPVSSVSRPKTPTSSRPKTPTSSVSVNRPKTPVSVSRPKTPVSLTRPKTPVDTPRNRQTLSTPSNVQSTPKQQTVAKGVTNQPQSPGYSYSNSIKPVNSSNSLEQRRHEDNSESTSEKRSTADKPNVAYVCITADDADDVKPRASTFPRSGTYSHSSPSNSGMKSASSQDGTEFVASVHDNSSTSQTETKGDSTGSSDSLIQSFNALQKSIAELRNRAQQACIAGDNLRKDGVKKTNEESKQCVYNNYEGPTSGEGIKSMTVSLSHVRNVSSSSDLSSTRSNDCAPVGILKRSQTSEESLGRSETDTSSTSNRRASQGDSVSSEPTRRPSTPVGRPSTPSLIPRPMTPVGGLTKPQAKPESSIPQPTSSRSEPAKTGSNRPPTPKKATILAKSPSAARNTANKSASENSYRSIYQNKRSTTPGPNEFRSMSVPERENPVPRRSVTPGPDTRSNTRTSLHTWRSPSLTQPKDAPKNESNVSDNSIIERNRIRAASASPMLPRKPQNQTPRTISRQKAVEENITVSVDRESGRHSISVKDGENTKYKSERPVARVLARAPTPTQRVSADSSDSDNRGRTRTFEAPKPRPRPRSVDPENWNRGKEEEVVMVVQRTDKGGHKIQDRTEAWVESAAKTVASRTPTNNRKVSQNLRRSKTPNPNDVYENEFQSRSLSEIKASLTLPVNGLKEVNPDELDAPPEDPEMYAKMEVLFQKMRERELKASVNETPGQEFMPELDVEGIENEDESSLDSNENIKRKNIVTRGSSPASRVQTSVPSTPPRSKTPISMSRSSSSSQPLSRPVSTPPRPSTPTRSSFSSSRRSSTKSSNESGPPASPSSAPPPSPGSAPVQHPISTNVDHAVVIVSKIKEILNPKPRKDGKTGPRSRIPAPKSLASSGKSKSFSNLSSPSSSEWSLKKQNTVDQNYINGNTCFDADFDEYDGGEEISGITARSESSSCSDNVRSQSGTKTPVPKLATPLTTGRKAVLNRESTDKSSKLVRAVSISSLSSSSNTMSCPTQDEEEFV